MEYEKTEVNSGFFYKSADEREKLISAERKFIEDRVKRVIEFKRKVCAGDDKKSFVIINQKGLSILIRFHRSSCRHLFQNKISN
jgi:T-complex protein 1 subunit zeta